MYVCMYVCMYVSMYVCVYVCMYVCTLKTMKEFEQFTCVHALWLKRSQIKYLSPKIAQEVRNLIGLKDNSFVLNALWSAYQVQSDCIYTDLQFRGNELCLSVEYLSKLTFFKALQ